MSPIDAGDLARSLVGTTIPTPALSHPNSVLAVEGSNVIVATEDSPEGAPVSLRMLQRGIDILFETGEVQIARETFDGYRRSSAIGAILATLPAIDISDPPVHIRLTSEAPLRDGLVQACVEITEDRTADNVRAEDPYHQLMVHELPGAVRPIVANDAGFKVRGSAGQVNFPWAETPWVAVFDRLVTESALRGHYIVYLVHPTGAGVYLSLNQAVTEVRAGGRGRYREVLEAQATRFRSHLSPADVGGLIQGPIDLAGRGDRTRGYEAGNIVALFLPAGQVPHDAELVTHLRRFLALYERTTAGLDEEESAANADAPGEAQTGTESRRYRWHLRAEGRNRTRRPSWSRNGALATRADTDSDPTDPEYLGTMRTWAAFAAVVLFAVGLPPGAGGAEVRTWHTDSHFVDPSKAESGYNHPGRPPRPNALRVNVYLPDGYDASSRRRYPVLFLLHGVGDAYDSWVLPGQGEIMEIARGFRGIIVMPEADRGYYTNWWNGGRRGDPGWERYHLDELIPLVERRLPIRQRRRWHSIYGFSMGGMGAMFYASQRPHYFGSAGASQGTLSLQRPEFQSEPAFRAFIEQDPQAIFGDPQAQEFYWAGHNPTRLVANLVHTRLYVAVGDGIPAEDESPGPGQLSELEIRLQSEDFVAAARAAGLNVTYRPQRGTHDWPSRRRHLTYAMREWGLFKPAVARPAAWTYKTVARFGRMWGFRFRFAEAPERVNAFSLAANRLSGDGSGRVKIRTPGGCRFVATLPFERALSPDCRASAPRRPLCGGRRATVIGTPGNDVLRGTRKSDVIVALDGNDSVSGLGGNDRVCAGGGRDVVRGRNGNDRLAGQQGRDRLLGGPGGDRLEGGRGADTLVGGPGRDVLKGGRGTDDLSQ